MPKYFFNETPHSELEHDMMAVPNFAPRRSGVMILCQFHYRREDVDCKNCLLYKKPSCRVGCPYIVERLEAGAVTYAELVAACFRSIRHAALQSRIKSLSSQIDQFNFRDLPHIQRMYGYLRTIEEQDGLSQWTLAVLYLFSASESLWQNVRPALHGSRLEAAEVVAKDLSLQDYILFRTGKNLYRGLVRITPAELADQELVSDDTLLLIVNALLIVRYGKMIINVRFNEVQE